MIFFLVGDEDRGGNFIFFLGTGDGDGDGAIVENIYPVDNLLTYLSTVYKV